MKSKRDNKMLSNTAFPPILMNFLFGPVNVHVYKVIAACTNKIVVQFLNGTQGCKFPLDFGREYLGDLPKSLIINS